MTTIAHGIVLLFLVAVVAADLSKEEIDCLNKFQYYHEPTKSCHNILSRGPCRAGEWFVLRKPQKTDTEDIVKAECKKEPCAEGRKYWVDKGCVKDSDKTKLCGSSDKVILGENDFGEAECLCLKSPPHARLNDDPKNECYQLYKRGPCSSGQILAIPPGGTIPQCLTDPCYEESIQKKKNEEIRRTAVLAQFEGKCYELDTQGPCKEKASFKVSSDGRAECILQTLSLSIVGGCNGLLGCSDGVRAKTYSKEEINEIYRQKFENYKRRRRALKN